MSNNHLFWFRQDLRLKDNPGLSAALTSSEKLMLIYIFDDKCKTEDKIGSASLWWLHKSLSALSEEIEALGGKLILKRGDPKQILFRIASEKKIDKVFWNRCYEPYSIKRDTKLKAKLKEAGISVKSFNGSLLFEPGTVKTLSGNPYKVFTPFWKKGCLSRVEQIPSLFDAPKSLPEPLLTESERLADWHILPSLPNWAKAFTEFWEPGEIGAEKAIEHFLETGIKGYKTLRNRPDLGHVSRLSPHLHWGEIAPWRIWRQVESFAQCNQALSYQDLEHFFSELGWREFSYHLLFHYPELAKSNWRKQFDAFPWKKEGIELKLWQQGKTGFPIVDAGMHELWTTGWMHNRVRMIVASFLIKDLMIDWRQGAAWFWDTLVDADLANNSAGWQWVAGSGADASPYFRVFNPVVQGERFDPNGDYVRYWCPELKALPNKWIHKPWEASPETLLLAGVELGVDYPRPIVNHAAARDAALAAYKALPREP